MAFLYIAVLLDDKTTTAATFQVDNPSAIAICETLEKAPGLMAHESTGRIAAALTHLAEAKFMTFGHYDPVEVAARAAHEANRIYCSSIGDAGTPGPASIGTDMAATQPAPAQNPPDQMAETKVEATLPETKTLEVNTPAMAPVTE